VQPICKVCKNLGRPCTYNRPERKRGPSQGVRQKLESHIESLESLLGYVVDTYPHVCCEAVKHLRLEEAEEAISNPSRPLNALSSSNSASSSTQLQIGQIYPHYSKLDAREIWKASSFAKAVGPGLSLSLGMEDEDDEFNGFDGWRTRVEEARRARARLRSGITTNASKNYGSVHTPEYQHHPYPYAHQQQTMQHGSGHHHPHHAVSSHGAQQPSQSSSHLPQYPTTAPPPSSSSSQHLPQYSQSPLQQHQISSRKLEHLRQDTGFTSSSPQPSTSFISDSPHHQQQQQSPNQFSQPSHHYYAQQQRPLETPFAAVTPSNAVSSHLESYAPAPPTSSSYDGETDALAYALGLTSYAASPQSGHTGLRMDPLHGQQQQPWVADSPVNTSSSSHQHINQVYHAMHVQDEHAAQHQESSSHDGSSDNTGLLYFPDITLENRSSNNQMSILHQLGLQGIVDMPTPVNAGGDPGDTMNTSLAAGASVVKSTSGSADSHHLRPNQWLQTIQGIN
jgi:hypothetical protein